MVTMLLGGLWHGAGWNFVLWGGLHGVALSLYHRFAASWDRLSIPVRRASLFVFIVLSWVPFRLRTMHDIVACYRAMFAFNFHADVPLRLLVVGGGAALVALFVKRNANAIDWDELGPAPAFAMGFATFVALLYLNRSAQFLYFQF
jgi:D-alanyl-lipoteichoic acid acyltransferase DltB (MBOAT superfamily)